MQKIIEKRKQTHISNADYWRIASILIENKCVIQDPVIPEKSFTIWRVNRAMAIKEVMEAAPELPPISHHHLNKAVEFFNEVCIITKKMPEVPAIQDTVEMDQLTATNKKQALIISELEKTITTLTATIMNTYKAIEPTVAALKIHKRA